MPKDIVFPKGNENEFLEIAERLGYDSIVFVYEIKDKIPKMPDSKIKLAVGLLADQKSVQSAKKHAGIVLVKSSANDRWIIEKSQADILFGLEEVQKKDFMHHRASGLNHILCKIASEKGKAIGFSFSSILNSDRLKRAQIIGRMQQNARLCRKYKVKTVFASFAKNPYEMRAPKDMEAFKHILGL